MSFSAIHWIASWIYLLCGHNAIYVASYSIVILIFLFTCRSDTSPENNKHDVHDVYDEVNDVKTQPETSDNPQYGDTMKQSDSPAGQKANENVYSYAVP